MTHTCRVCGNPLIIGDNIAQQMIDRHNYICRKCASEYRRRLYYLLGRHQPMNKNKSCPMFLGVHVAERVLSHVFKHVERMSVTNHGYDFICGKGYKVDVKSACRNHHKGRSDWWQFAINKNQIAEYFLCLAFDNREDLNPEHIWLIPANDVNHLMLTSIGDTTLSKWDEYKLDVDRVSACCNIIKNNPKIEK